MRFEYTPGQTPIDPDEAQGLIPALSTQAELNEFELLNIVEAARWAETSRTIRGNLLSIEALKMLHRRMFDRTWKWAGQYRLTQKSIGVQAYRISTELQMLVEDVKCWLELGTYRPDEIAARFHHRLVWIHPFPNGNGRHARLATDLLARREGWPAFTWGVNSPSSPEEVRRAYIQALQSADSRNFWPLTGFLRA